MKISRRQLLRAGGGIAAALPVLTQPARGGNIVEIVMGGGRNGAHVWFDPVGLLVNPGQTIRWTNRDGGNSHSATAYHPDNYRRSRRIPDAASAWDSDLLLPGETFSVTLTELGVYDFYCIPHEHAGMVGRIVVSGPVKGGWTEGDLPEIALRSFPPVEQIMVERVVRRG